MFDWFTNQGIYHTLDHCLAGDWPWIWKLVSLDLLIWCGYLVIAFRWRSERKDVKNPQRTQEALGKLFWIFVLCGVTYIWSLVDLFWPGWRLLVFAKIALVYVTWSYIFGSSQIHLVYRELNRVELLEAEILVLRREIRSLRDLLVQMRGDM